MEQISAKKLKAMEKVKRANAELAKVCVLSAWQSSKEQSFTRRKVCPVSPSMFRYAVKMESEVRGMTVKNISTRAKICGRSAKCKGGHSAVEQSAYISREKMYCEYDGQTYYPKYSEDLVHCEVLLPENEPEEYKDPYGLS